MKFEKNKRVEHDEDVVQKTLSVLGANTKITKVVSVLSNAIQVFKVGLYFIHVGSSERYGLLGLVVGVRVIVIQSDWN